MKDKNKKVRRYYQKKKNSNKRKKIKIIVGIILLVLIVASIFIFKSCSNKEKQVDSKKNETLNTENIEIKAKAVDETVLKDLIENAKKIQTETYTKESVDTFNTALEEAKSLLQGKFEQSQVEDACKKLVDSIQNLQKK